MIAVTIGWGSAAGADPGVQIAAGWFVQGGSVTGPGITTPRPWSADQAAAFFESWFPAQMFGRLQAEKPPASLPKYTVELSDTVNGTSQHITIYYVTDGRNAWLNMPLQSLGPGAEVNRLVWDKAPQRAIDAFAGKVHAIPVTGASEPAPASTAAPAKTTSHSSGGAPIGWIIVGIALVVVAGICFFAFRRRGAHRSANGRDTREASSGEKAPETSGSRSR
jgi:hypothetical protein